MEKTIASTDKAEKKEVTLSVYPYRSAMSRDCDTPILVYRFDHGSAQHAQHYHAHCP